MTIKLKTYHPTPDMTQAERDEHEHIVNANRNLLRPGMCAEDGGHTVTRPAIWPPRQRAQGRRGRDYASARCTRCGAWVIIYDPLQEGVRFADTPKAASKS